MPKFDDPEYEEISLPDDELDIEEGTEGIESNDEEEYYSDYGEETDQELQKDLPDATGKIHNLANSGLVSRSALI